MSLVKEAAAKLEEILAFGVDLVRFVTVNDRVSGFQTTATDLICVWFGILTTNRH